MTTYIYSVSSRTNYNNTKEKYENILVINEKPIGNLLNIVKEIKPFNNSSFKSNNNKCIYCFFNNDNEIMTTDDIPSLLNFLINNDYEIDNSLSKIYKNKYIDKHRFIFLISIIN